MANPGADLIEAVIARDTPRVTGLLAADPTLANARDSAGVSAIMLSRYRSDRPTMDALLAADPDLDVYEAAALGYIDRLNARLDEDPERASTFSADGFTALHFAAFFGKPEAARTLLEAGAAVNVTSRNDQIVQPLHSAAAGLHHEVCRLLIAAGAITPLHEAAQHGDIELVELFLSAGADPAAVTDDGKTPADTADASGHVDVARRLREVAAERAG